MGNLGKLVLTGILAVAMQGLVEAQDSCPPWRPCGPGNSWGGNRGLKQGFFGADFRPACAQHDACLAGNCGSRKDCDRQFLANMNAACDCSENPAACRRKARTYYLGARLFGGLYR